MVSKSDQDSCCTSCQAVCSYSVSLVRDTDIFSSVQRMGLWKGKKNSSWNWWIFLVISSCKWRSEENERKYSRLKTIWGNVFLSIRRLEVRLYPCMRYHCVRFTNVIHYFVISLLISVSSWVSDLWWKWTSVFQLGSGKSDKTHLFSDILSIK